MKQLWRRPTEYYRKIDVLPFTIVLLVLMIVFWFDPHPSHVRSVELAKVKHVIPLSNALREDTLHVAVERDGHLFFENQQIAISELQVKLREGIGNGAEKRVYLHVDSRARYGTVKAVLDSVAAAQIQNVSFLTELSR